ncbi:zinc finger CCCH domain-containing protein 13-like isoform X1 [Teleopsis dalmanni]|uniref:zinc finger CCCH domain-containing protein 13-like isoform X1 n=1 Tax=Teleopsis dalmanni TaxID=139649 RepID=UPI0018CFA942|nr:zinc finger CCCH domain-containing protein 13-like isoform X1 [Teleopsis dalmanni]XP_037937747.1 zinc finger CCCH domain-containing protein 13-like isoform X1 [Teleopsis dalmanni]XP_037937748.1 zinc finger CCCH domain-containing protein 13-like isoform X1 [Teleopsis dalmanni]
MALRLRRDVQKASYYVWFLGAEEAKGLRGARVINSVLPYLIDRSRSQEPLKVTLQVSHKGIKILQGSSKHFIPHSAITSSVQTDDIVACVLLLYNPATKCPLHVHAYRCDSESTAEALHQQLQILINRPENQKRFEELETRLGILPPLPLSSNKLTASNNNNEHSQKQVFQSQHQQQRQQTQQQRRHETSPKRFSSSLGSDNSTRESEYSEEHSSGSPISRSPPIVKPLPQPTNELFDSLAAELRAKLNGNGPPLLLPPRDYDTVHRSKGNLTAIELRRCRNALIVGGPTVNSPTAQTAATNGKQVSSRGSSGIGSDLAPSPERQELNSSSDDEHWSNEADNSVIALKPSQIPVERSIPIIPHHPLLNRKSAIQPPEDSYLRDLPAKPYAPRSTTNNNNSNNNNRDKIVSNRIINEREQRSKTPSSTSWSKEDEIKPIIMRPADYDAKFNRVMQAEQKPEHNRRHDATPREHAKLHDTDKYNEINRLLNKKLSLEQRPKHKSNEVEDFDDSDPSIDQVPPHAPSSYRKENLTDKQKFLEYNSKKQTKSYAAEEVQRYGGRHRYVDPADLPFDQPTHNKYAAVHHTTHSPERAPVEPEHRNISREKERYRERERERERDNERGRDRERDREREREHFSRSNERNPYREPESIPYIQSMEKMMKSSAMRYKSFEGVSESVPSTKEEAHTKVSQRSKSYPKNDDDKIEYNRGRSEYAASASSNVSPKERFKDAKDKFRAMERNGSRYDLADEHDGSEYKSRRHGSRERSDKIRTYDNWSDDEYLDDAPPAPVSRSRSQWEHQSSKSRDRTDFARENSREHIRERERDTRDHRDYGRDNRQREPSSKRSDPKDIREYPREPYREHRYEQRSTPRDAAPIREHKRDSSREYIREHVKRDYSPDARSDHRSDYTVRSNEKQRLAHPHSEKYPSSPPSNGAPISNGKNLSNLNKGYRHSYAEPVFARSGGRVGLAAVNPY